MGVPTGEQLIERVSRLRGIVESGFDSANASYRAELMTSSAAFLKMEQSWQVLLAATGETALFLGHAWLREWWRCFENKQPFLILVFNHFQQLVAVAPLQISKGESGILTRPLRKLQFAGTEPDVYDWMKILVHPAESESMILSSIAETIRQAAHRWDVIDLRFCKDRRQLECLLSHLRITRQNRACEASIVESMTIPQIDLPDSVAAYRADCSKKSYRSDLRRIRNHIQRDFDAPGFELEFLSPSEESAALLDDFLACHKRYWSNKGQQTQCSRHPALARFYRDIFKSLGVPCQSRAQFAFSILKANGRAISYHIDILHENGCMGYLACYNPEFKKYRPGILHIEALIEHTLKLGGKRFEFGRGDASYKHQWNIRQMPVWDLLLFGSQWARMLWQGDQVLKKLKSDFNAKKQAHHERSLGRKNHA